MNYLQSILLGLIQGVTEFLPVSSSGHLFLGKEIFGLSEVPLLFDIFLHMATLVVVFFFFRKKIAELFMSFVRLTVRKADEKDKANGKVLLFMVVATLVTVAVGIPINNAESLITFPVVCVCLIITGLMLISTRFMKSGKDLSVLTFPKSLFIGLIQGIAVLPGISRSGSTISAGLFAGISKEQAGEFSFILSIPAILGAFVLKMKDFNGMDGLVSVPVLLAGIVAAIVSGFAALSLLIFILKKAKLHYFAFYVIPVGIAGLIWYFVRG